MAVSVIVPVSLFQLFSIGIGPSSSHTVGPMRAAVRFLKEIEEEGKLEEIAMVQVELYGSLAMTGKGHATDLALILGLEGNTPEEVDPNQIDSNLDRIEKSGFLRLLGKHRVPFTMKKHLLFLFISVECPRGPIKKKLLLTTHPTFI